MQEIDRKTREKKKKRLANLHLRSGGAEWENACVCNVSDHFVKGVLIKLK